MRSKLAALVAVLMLIAAACGDDDVTDLGDDGGTPTTAATTNGDIDDMDDMDDSMGDSYADLTFDGTTVRFAASGLTYSQVEGVDDITLERCDPSFFGQGFWVIGYPVDDNGDLVIADELGNLGGGLTALIPFEGTAPDVMEFEFSVEYDPLTIDARYREDNPAPTYSFDGNRVSGTVTLDNLNTDPIEVTFDITCAG
ncbi:MAG TPA: hypothetical protein VK960_04230 [Acidimicrobiia bacterium]|nr:hypothetical protein [Acidimicrobiia bacterium]